MPNTFILSDDDILFVAEELAWAAGYELMAQEARDKSMEQLVYRRQVMDSRYQVMALLRRLGWLDDKAFCRDWIAIWSAEPERAFPSTEAIPPAETIRELMVTYDTYRQRWIRAYGDDGGFNAWFTHEVVGQKPRPKMNYVLTDGHLRIDFRKMSVEEAAEENRIANKHASGEWWWMPI